MKKKKVVILPQKHLQLNFCINICIQELTQASQGETIGGLGKENHTGNQQSPQIFQSSQPAAGSHTHHRLVKTKCEKLKGFKRFVIFSIGAYFMIELSLLGELLMAQLEMVLEIWALKRYLMENWKRKLELEVCD